MVIFLSKCMGKYQYFSRNFLMIYPSAEEKLVQVHMFWCSSILSCIRCTCQRPYILLNITMGKIPRTFWKKSLLFSKIRFYSQNDHFLEKMIILRKKNWFWEDCRFFLTIYPLENVLYLDYCDVLTVYFW